MDIPEGFKQTEVGVIPNDWESRPLDKLSISIASGKSKTRSQVGAIFPIYGSTEIIGFRQKPDYEGKRILLARVGANAGTVNHVDGKYCVSDNTLMVQLIREIDFSFIFYFLIYSDLNKLIFGSGQPLITGTQLKNLVIPVPPTKAEQIAIATALNDSDQLITQLEQLIAKKRNIKQAAMQALLKPKAGWEAKNLGDVLKIRHGKSQKEVIDENGAYPILASGGVIGRSKAFLYNKPSVLIGRKGTIDKPLFMNTPFWTVDTLFYTEIADGYDAKFIFYLFNLIDWYSYNEASGVPSLNAKTIELIEKHFPKTQIEQTQIAQILTDMDTELEALEQKLAKYRMLKQGLMQILLTGKIRLM